MDDTLEQPKHYPNLDAVSGERVEDREQDASDDEDGGLDWTKLPSVPSLLHVHSVLLELTAVPCPFQQCRAPRHSKARREGL